MTKYNVYESIALSGCEPINTWVASFCLRAMGAL